MNHQTNTQNLMNDMGEEQHGAPMEGCSTEDNSSAHPENTDSGPPRKKNPPSDTQTVPEELKSKLPPDCLRYAKRWLSGEAVKPDELQDFVHQILKAGVEQQVNENGGKRNEVPDQTEPPSKDNKSSSSFIKSWFFSPSTPAVTLGFVVTGETFGAHHTIISQLKDKQLKFTAISSNKQDQCPGIVVFCPVISRAGSDVDAAMRNPAVSSSNKPLFLVLLYHTRDPEYSTGGKRCSERFPRIHGEVHVLFHETLRGLLSCALNNQATYELKQAIYKNFSLS